MAGAEACQNLQWSDTPMKDDSTIISLRQSDAVLDPLTEIAREGAQRMLSAALKAEVDCFLALQLHFQVSASCFRLMRSPP